MKLEIQKKVETSENISVTARSIICNRIKFEANEKIAENEILNSKSIANPG